MVCTGLIENYSHYMLSSLTVLGVAKETRLGHVTVYNTIKEQRRTLKKII